MKSFLNAFLVFLILNFSALGIGSWLMNNGPQSEWYTNLNKAPWTPEGWVFGAAWFTVMLCFAFYMAFLYKQQWTSRKAIIYGVQLVLNISWNYLFFNQHLITIGLINLILLTSIVYLILITYWKDLKSKSFFIAPYALWLLIAISLNLYIYIYN
ncbi:TspO/MBR family protein [Psychroserpens sp. XS_ASV72]|uniref:TspO/MBR family protein n=1 Tax=Psychroserpens sp. XS_ASV72 TaxID=3241293 RepID=UPI003511A42A